MNAFYPHAATNRTVLLSTKSHEDREVHDERRPARKPWGRLSVAAAVAAMLLSAASCAPKTAVVTAPVAGAARFPEFVYPAPPAGMAGRVPLERHLTGWNALQSGDLRTADRSFAAAVKEAPGFYPAEAGLGYVALARKDARAALAHFDRALAPDATYAPALAGRGEALLSLGNREQALASFQAAVSADPSLTALGSRIEVLRFREVQEEVAAARKASEAGRLPEARAAYERALARSPQSPFLYRELSAVDRREGNMAAALEHAQKASALEPNDPRNLIAIAETYEAQGEMAKAIDVYGAAVALEPNPAIDARIDALAETIAFAAMPPEYRSIETAPSVTRAQLAALVGVRLDALLKRAPRGNAAIISDTRGNWAAPWILSVTRAGIMDAYPNHTFQPNAVVRRGDLAMAASRVLSLIAAEKPAAAAAWRSARRRFPDLSQGHLSYPAASLAVQAGVMTTLEDGSFQLSRPVTGAEAVAAVKKLDELSSRTGR